MLVSISSFENISSINSSVITDDKKIRLETCRGGHTAHLDLKARLISELDQMSTGLARLNFENLQGWRFYCPSVQSILRIHCSHIKECFTSLVQLVPFVLHCASLRRV